MQSATYRQNLRLRHVLEFGSGFLLGTTAMDVAAPERSSVMVSKMQDLNEYIIMRLAVRAAKIRLSHLWRLRGESGEPSKQEIVELAQCMLEEGGLLDILMDFGHMRRSLEMELLLRGDCAVLLRG